MVKEAHLGETLKLYSEIVLERAAHATSETLSLPIARGRRELRLDDKSRDKEGSLGTFDDDDGDEEDDEQAAIHTAEAAARGTRYSSLALRFFGALMFIPVMAYGSPIVQAIIAGGFPILKAVITGSAFFVADLVATLGFASATLFLFWIGGMLARLSNRIMEKEKQRVLTELRAKRKAAAEKKKGAKK